MKNIPIAFIGGGNMARSLIGGLVAGGHEPDRIWVAEPVGTEFGGGGGDRTPVRKP